MSSVYKGIAIKFDRSKLFYQKTLYSFDEIIRISNGYKDIHAFNTAYLRTSSVISLILGPLFSMYGMGKNDFTSLLAGFFTFMIFAAIGYPLGLVIRGANNLSQRYLTLHFSSGKTVVVDFQVEKKYRQVRELFEHNYTEHQKQRNYYIDQGKQTSNHRQPVNFQRPTTKAFAAPTLTQHIPPEEQVRRHAIQVLTQQCGYLSQQIAIEFPIRVGSSNRRIDIAVFSLNQPQTQENIILIVECKRADRRNDEEGLAQLKSYLSVCMNVQYGVLASHRWVTLRKEVGAQGWAFVPSEYTPHSNGYFLPIRYNVENQSSTYY